MFLNLKVFPTIFLLLCTPTIMPIEVPQSIDSLMLSCNSYQIQTFELALFHFLATPLSETLHAKFHFNR